ncbi:hypothetical protein HB778_40470 (plasmid) [Mesorhizobium huakuii]|uniref:Uncharacterized protein n=1 Tax=Mesorhizobium huakuii TaxID=28104 RepID=A0A7G6T6N2_9HYPH|nr:hypothetical protein HB778_40470 [Mesorhizobium huakuii]
MGILTALAAGAISFLSPCVLPVVPGYVSYMVGNPMVRQRHAADHPSPSSRGSGRMRPDHSPGHPPTAKDMRGSVGEARSSRLSASMGILLAACPSMRELARGDEIRYRRDFLARAELVRPMLGSPRARGGRPARCRASNRPRSR